VSNILEAITYERNIAIQMFSSYGVPTDLLYNGKKSENRLAFVVKYTRRRLSHVFIPFPRHRKWLLGKRIKQFLKIFNFQRSIFEDLKNKKRKL